MICGRTLTVVIPARGGSKGIPGKNLYRIGEKTLVERAIDLARGCEAVDAIYVSTDDPETYHIAQAHQCATPHLRPAALASDRTRTIDVIADLVQEGVLGHADVILLLQPTSPLRLAADLSALLEKFEREWNQADAVVSVCEVDGPHPYKAQIIENHYLTPLLGADSTVPRQSLPKVFLPNGAFYAGKLEVLLSENTFVPRRSFPFKMSAVTSVNLDAPLDVLLLEAILQKKLVLLDDHATRVDPHPKLAGALEDL